MSQEPSTSAPTESTSTAPAADVGVSGSIIGRLFRQPRFLIAAAVLLIGAIGFNAASLALQLHFRKQPLPLRVKALDHADGIPKMLNNRWLMAGVDEPLKPDVEKALGATNYLTRTYVDLKAINNVALESQLRSDDQAVVKKAIAELAARTPEAVVSVHLAYYTGLVDTVAHIPDRCMVASGFRPVEGAQTLDGPERGGEPVKFRFLNFEDATLRGMQSYQVAYLFHVNGAYEADPWKVRSRLQSLLLKYGYYMKIELSVRQTARATGAADPEALKRSTATMKALLTDLLPEVERCLPDWAAATGSAPAAQ
jgi:hypothetical protein